MTPWTFIWQSSLLQIFLLGLVLVVAVAVSSVRHEPDPAGRRLTATYLGVVLFFSLFTALMAGTTAVGSAVEALVGDTGSSLFGSSVDEFGESEGDDFEDEEGDEDEVASMVRSLLLAAVAGAVLVYHRRRLLDLLDDDPDGPATRVAHSYLYTASAVALLAFVLGASMGLFGFVKVLVPESVSTHEVEETRDEGAREVFTWGFLAVASLAVVALHQQERDRLDGVDDESADVPDEQETPEYPIA